MKTTLVFILLFTFLRGGSSPFGELEGKVGKDTIALNEVVKTEHLTNNVSNTSPFTDLKYRQGERLSDALSEFSSVHVKNYGNGGLATLSFCGTSAEQTSIEWNGIRLNSPSLGQQDISQFLIATQDELQLVRTGYQGNIGGILRLNNEIKRDSGFSIGVLFRASSFATYNTALDAQYAKGKFSGSTKFVYLTSLNNFPYVNNYAEGNPVVYQTNATVKQLSVLQQFNAKINANQQLNFYGWFTNVNRQLAPLMSQSTSAQTQDDYSIRAMMDWKGNFHGVKLKFTTAWMKDYLRYKDPNALLDEISTTYASRNKFNVSYMFAFNLALNGEVNYEHEQANIKDYGSNKARNVEGIRCYGDYYFREIFIFHAGFREDLVDNNLSAFAPEGSITYSPKLKHEHHFSASIMASRNFRFPTLNDLYWVPGGNLNLKEEKSLNEEIQAKYSWKKIAEVSVSNFYIYAQNWIQWTPAGNIWQAENLKRVFSRGIEASVHFTNAIDDNPRKFTFHFNASYTFTKTTNLDALSPTDQSMGKQLIYLPYHNVTAGMQFAYRRFYIRSVNTYTGLVYVTTDNSQSLSGYFISNIEIGKEFVFKTVELGLSLRANNLSNKQYQAYVQRPMPGRNFEGTVRFKFSK